MSPRRARAGAIVRTIGVVAAVASGCALRVGSGGPPNDGDPGAGEVFGTSACARDGAETKVAFGSGAQSFAFTWDTDHYVVVYPDPTSGDIFVGKLAGDASPQGSPVAVQQTPAKSDLPSLLRTSSGYVVAWQEGSAGNAVYAATLAPDATPASDGVSVAATQLEQSRPVLARTPDGQAALAYMDQFADGSQGVQVVAIESSPLRATRTQRLMSSEMAGWPWIAGDDHGLAIVWQDESTQSNGAPSYDIPFATMDPQSLQASAPTSLRGRGQTAANLPRMIRTDFGFLAAWEDMRASDNEIFMALVDPSGRRLAGGLVEEPNSGDANWPNMAWTGKAAGIVYYQWRDSRPQIFMSFVDSTGARVGGLHDLQVSNGQGGSSKYPDVVWTGSEFGVMYVDTRSGAPALWFQRVSCHR